MQREKFYVQEMQDSIFMLISSLSLIKASVKANKQQLFLSSFFQCCGSITFGVDPDPRVHVSEQWIRIWILLFSTLTFKTFKDKSKRIQQQESKFSLLFLLDDRRIRIRIHTYDQWIRIQKAKKHTDPVDPDTQHCFFLNFTNDAKPLVPKPSRDEQSNESQESICQRGGAWG